MKTTSNVLLTAIVAAVNTTPHGVFAVERRLLAETERRQLFETHTGGNMYVKRLGGQAESKEVEEPNSAAPTSKPVPTPIQKCLFGLANSGFDLFAIEKYNDWMDNETTFELAETGVRRYMGITMLVTIEQQHCALFMLLFASLLHNQRFGQGLLTSQSMSFLHKILTLFSSTKPRLVLTADTLDGIFK